MLTLVVLVGFGAGLAASFRVWPVSCSGASPAHLGRAERCSWVGWTADAYREDGDLARALAQVSALGGEANEALCSLARGECRACRTGQAEAGQALAVALGVDCSAQVAP